MAFLVVKRGGGERRVGKIDKLIKMTSPAVELATAANLNLYMCIYNAVSGQCLTVGQL